MEAVTDGNRDETAKAPLVAILAARSSPARPRESLLVVNLGRPGENAWYDRRPRPELSEVVLDG